MRLTLKDDGYQFLKIMSGRKWIGRVYKEAAGTWGGTIVTTSGRLNTTGHATSKEAFQQIGSELLGCNNVDELHAKNARVRARNRAAKAEGRAAGEAMLRGNFEPFFNLLKRAER